MSEPVRTSHQASARDGATVLELAACSDRGPVRTENQDAWAITPLDGRGAIVILADGMGGHADGAVASYLAVTNATERLAGAEEPRLALGDAVAEANVAIARRRSDTGGSVSGTTLIAAVVSGGRASLVNVGDSRAYLLRDGVAHQVTLDHSWIAEEVRAGRVPADGAGKDPRRNILTRALTGDPVEADGFEVDLGVGDALVLCSDGVWDMLGATGLADCLGGGRPLGEETEEAVTRAIAAGATDNVTVVACRVLPGE